MELNIPKLTKKKKIKRYKDNKYRIILELCCKFMVCADIESYVLLKLVEVSVVVPGGAVRIEEAEVKLLGQREGRP